MITERFKALGKVQNIHGEEFDFKGRASISESGVVFVHPIGKKTGWFKIGRPAGGGHYQVSLTDNFGKQALFFTHRLVAHAWLRKPKAHKTVVMHVDENPANNHYTNLKWGTQKENLNAARKHKKIQAFKMKYENDLIWEVYYKKENGASIKELIQEYNGKIAPGSIMHMTSGRMLKLRGLI
jgi:hypothetical protein